MEKARTFEISLVLLLIVCAGLLFYLIELTAAPTGAQGWEMAANGSIDYMFIGSNDTLYTFQGNNVTAILPDGTVKWSFHVQGDLRLVNNWSVSDFTPMNGINYNSVQPYVVANESAGTLYVYAFQSLSQSDIDTIRNNGYVAHTSQILALSPQGELEWMYPVTGEITIEDIEIDQGDMAFALPDPVAICGQNGRLYVYHDHREDVLRDNGSLLFTLNNVSEPAAVDEKGNAYIVKATSQANDHPVYVADGSDDRNWDFFVVSPQGNLTDGSSAPVTVTSLTGQNRSEYEQLTEIARISDGMDIYHGYTDETWINGTLLANVTSYSRPIVVETNGDAYGIAAIRYYGKSTDNGLITVDKTEIYTKGPKIPVFTPVFYSISGTVEAYGPEGKLLWSCDTGESIRSLYTEKNVRHEYDTLPLYRNHTLYAFVSNGVVALDTGGNLQWVRHLDTHSPYGLMSVDNPSATYSYSPFMLTEI